MGLYRFKEKGPAYGLGHTEGEIVSYDEKNKIVGMPLVPLTDRDGKLTGRQAIVRKEYTVEYLIESGVIVQANEIDKKKFSDKKDINSIADAFAASTRKLENEQFEARKALMK